MGFGFRLGISIPPLLAVVEVQRLDQQANPVPLSRQQLAGGPSSPALGWRGGIVTQGKAVVLGETLGLCSRSLNLTYC